jgi:hypothetical protein
LTFCAFYLTYHRAMKTLITLTIAASMLHFTIAQAQQNPQPTQPAPSAQAQPCTPMPPQPPSAVSNRVHFHLPTALQRALDKQRAELEKKTGIQLAPITPDDLTKQVQKPCTPAPALSSPTTNTLHPGPPPSAGAPSSIGKQTPAQAAPAPSNGAATVSPKQADFYADVLACLLKRQRDNDPSDPSTCIPSPPTTTTAPKQ